MASSSPLLLLSQELLCAIIDFLPLADEARLKRTCKAANNRCSRIDRLEAVKRMQAGLSAADQLKLVRHLSVDSGRARKRAREDTKDEQLKRGYQKLARVPLLFDDDIRGPYCGAIGCQSYADVKCETGTGIYCTRHAVSRLCESCCGMSNYLIPCIACNAHICPRCWVQVKLGTTDAYDHRFSICVPCSRALSIDALRWIIKVM